jgi:hypothetical protein
MPDMLAKTLIAAEKVTNPPEWKVSWLLTFYVHDSGQLIKMLVNEPDNVTDLRPQQPSVPTAEVLNAIQ